MTANSTSWIGRGAVACLAASLVALLATALAGESAAVPALGPRAAHPAWSLDLGWTSGAVTSVLVLAYLLGVAGVALGLLAIRRGARVRPRTVLFAAVVVLSAVAVVSPVGSGDHLNYAAYGRIAAAGDDPYLERPTGWHGGTDPVASASQPPWTGTRSVYGPVATALQAVASMVGGDSLRLTVWAWQLMVVAAFAVTAWLLDRLVRVQLAPFDVPAARTRVALLWTLNPLVLGPAVLGSHLDVLGVALVVATLSLMARNPLMAGLALGAAAGMKLPYALVGVAALWGLRRLPRPKAVRSACLGLLGAAIVLVPAHWWAGEHVYDQLERARRYVSLATPWRPFVDLLDPLFGMEPLRAAVGVLSVVAALVLAVVVGRLSRQRMSGGGSSPTASATRATWVLAAAWLLSAPYALPWYDALLWAPLAVLGAAGAGMLDAAVLVRAGVLALAYVPGRVVSLSPEVERLTLGFRAQVAPWVITGVLVWLMVQALAEARRPPEALPRPPAPGFARSPR
jgi:hypothetical protein